VKLMLGIALAYIVAVTLLCAFVAVAHERPRAHDAIVLCAHLAEDSAAHVRLVEYEHTPEGLALVYRCERTGY